jgi:hypothetical protein
MARLTVPAALSSEGGQNGATKTDSSESRMLVLAETIRTETLKLQAYLESNGIVQPGISVDAPDDFPPLPDDIQKSRTNIFLASRELTDIVRGPRETVRYAVWSVRDRSALLRPSYCANATRQYLDTLSLSLINRYQIGILKLHLYC